VGSGAVRSASRAGPLVMIGLIVVGTLIARRLGYKLGGKTVLRCRQGHLFSTMWIPGVKFEAVDLGVARMQRCPVGRHWTLVVPVRDAELTDEELARARGHRDVPIPG
jgi:hypothetical protein